MIKGSNEEILGEIAGQTLLTRFAATVEDRRDAPALRYGDRGASHLSWGDYAERACRVAAALSELGVRRGDRVVLMMANQPAFHIADMATMLLGATPVSIYNSSPPDQIAYLAGHCEAKVAIAGDVEYATRFSKVRSKLPELRHVVVIEGAEDVPGDYVPFSDLVTAAPTDLSAALGNSSPETLATLIYTSGTTGPPKGVMLTHRNLCWMVESMRRAFGADLAGWRVVSYLPMAHIGERAMTHYFHMTYGMEVTPCPDPTQVGLYLREVQPHTFFGVPRVWEKMHSGIQAAFSSDPGQRAAFEHAVAIGAQREELRRQQKPLPEGLAAAWAECDAGILSEARALVGLGEVEVAITAAAPLASNVRDFFFHIGIPLSEGYGLSEACGVVTFTGRDGQPGSVGRPLPGVEVKLLSDGELCCRSGGVFDGYLGDPEQTAACLDEDGWLHTGDLAAQDEDGSLRIIGRKKEIIITSGGKNISPANIEGALKLHPIIGQVCVVGDARPYVTALVVLDPDVAPLWAAERGIEWTDRAELATEPRVVAEIDQFIAETNARFNHVERVKRYRILPTEWLPDSDELTPTMKVKRHSVQTKYAAEIERLYESARPVVG